MRTQQQFGEIHQPGAVATFLVQQVGAAQGVGPRVIAWLDMLGAAAFVLLRIDPPGDLARRETAFVQFHLLHHALDQAQLVVGIQHLETFRQLGLLPMHAQETMGQPMESANPHATAAIAQLRIGAVAHFAGCLVGEGDREDAVHRHAVHFIQPRNAMGEHTGLAGACTGQHKVMPGRSGNRFALRGV